MRRKDKERQQARRHMGVEMQEGKRVQTKTNKRKRKKTTRKRTRKREIMANGEKIGRPRSSKWQRIIKEEQRGMGSRETDEEEEEERSMSSDEEERTVGEEDVSPTEVRKRPFERSEAYECSTSPNKRSKTDGGESDGVAAVYDRPDRIRGGETTPRPSTSALASATASPNATLAIVRQNSVVPGLEDTKSAV